MMEKPLSRLGDLEEAEQIASRPPLPSSEYTGSRYQTVATSTQILHIRGEWWGGDHEVCPQGALHTAALLLWGRVLGCLFYCLGVSLLPHSQPPASTRDTTTSAEPSDAAWHERL